MFRPLAEHELVRLDDDALIAYLRAARAVGHPSARDALGVLVYGHWHNVSRRVALKVPREYVEDVASEVPVSAIQSAFEGQSVGEFVVGCGPSPRAGSPTSTVVGRLDRAVGRRVGGVDPTTVVRGVEDAVARVLDRMSVLHRGSVSRWCSSGWSGGRGGRQRRDVHQITSRFRRALREELIWTSVHRLLEEFIAEDRAGGVADPAAYLARVSTPTRRAGGAARRVLARAPRRTFDRAAFGFVGRFRAVVEALDRRWAFGDLARRCAAAA